MNLPFVIYRSFDTGNVIAVINRYITLEYSRQEKDFGSIILDVPKDYGIDIFKIDGVLEVYRYNSSGVPVSMEDTRYLIRLVRYKTDEKRRTLIRIVGYDLNHILKRRIIPYKSGDHPDLTSCKGAKTGCADDMILQIARENIGTSSTDTNRDISKWISIHPNESVAPSISLEFPFNNMLETFKDICNASENAGKYLSFDVVPTDVNKCELRTYLYQRGTDRTSKSNKPIIFSLESNSLNYSSLTFDHTEEINYVYAGERGDNEQNITATAYDNNRISVSPINRIEDFITASETNDDGTAQDRANARLSESAPRIAVNGHLAQTHGYIYGVDFFFGDIITVRYMNREIDTHIDSVVITIENGSETVNIKARNLDEEYY